MEEISPVTLSLPFGTEAIAIGTFWGLTVIWTGFTLLRITPYLLFKTGLWVWFFFFADNTSAILILTPVSGNHYLSMKGQGTAQLTTRIISLNQMTTSMFGFKYRLTKDSMVSIVLCSIYYDYINRQSILVVDLNDIFTSISAWHNKSTTLLIYVTVYQIEPLPSSTRSLWTLKRYWVRFVTWYLSMAISKDIEGFLEVEKINHHHSFQIKVSLTMGDEEVKVITELKNDETDEHPWKTWLSPLTQTEGLTFAKVILM